MNSAVDQPQSQDMADLQEALTAALGSLRLEGLVPPAFARAQMDRVVAGEISFADMMAAILDQLPPASVPASELHRRAL